MPRFLSHLLILPSLALVLAATPTQAQKLNDDQVKAKIIEQSTAAYHASGRPCACPYDAARNGSSCGGRSAYSRPGGAAPLCYPADVTPDMVAQWRRQHGM